MRERGGCRGEPSGHVGADVGWALSSNQKSPITDNYVISKFARI